MTDSDGGLFGGLFGPPPPELMEEIQRRRAEHFMHLEDTRNKIEGLFDELPLDHLTALRSMLQEISSAGEKAETVADYYVGWAASMLKFKHGVCSHCGADHDHDALVEITKTAAGDQPTDTKEPTVTEDTSAEQPLESFREITEDERKLMDEYHLDDARIEGTNQLVGFICTGIDGGPRGGCGTIYVSIEDRMVKGPEDCSGCFAKAGQG